MEVEVKVRVTSEGQLDQFYSELQESESNPKKADLADAKLALSLYQNCLDPLRIDVVLDKIFAYLHLERNLNNTLLNYRLVNHFWNSKILSILHKQQKIIALDCRNAGQYLKIIKAANNNLSPGLKLRIKFDGDKEICALDSTKLLNCATELVKLFGPNCLESIHILQGTKIISTEDWLQLFKLIQNSSAGLEEIYIDEIKDCLHLQEVIFQRGRGGSSILGLHVQFLQLKSLYLNSPISNSYLAAKIINNSPLLEQLIIKPSLVRQKSDELLPRLVINTRNNNLKTLSISLYDRSSYKSLVYNIKFLPKLTKLTLTFTTEVTDQESCEYLQYFLSSSCCPKLESLIFEFLFSSNFSKEFPNILPKFLPTLKYFGYYFIPTIKTIQESPHFLKLDNCSLILQQQQQEIALRFPNLYTINTNLGVFLYMATNRHNRPYGRWYNNTFYLNNLTFPTVQCLELTLNVINYMNYVDGTISMKDNINQLHLLLPNLNHVIINNQIAPSTTVTRYYKKGQSVKDIIRILLQEMNGINKLEIKNYYEDWLTQILIEESTANEILHASMRNLVHLKFSTIEKNYKWSCPRVNLTKILTCMTNLRVLQLKPEHLTTDCYQNSSTEALTKLKEFQWLFPQVKIEFA